MWRGYTSFKLSKKGDSLSQGNWGGGGGGGGGVGVEL
jgi:hypothetical protein